MAQQEQLSGIQKSGGGGEGGLPQWNLNREYNRIGLDIHSVEEKKEKKTWGWGRLIQENVATRNYSLPGKEQ